MRRPTDRAPPPMPARRASSPERRRFSSARRGAQEWSDCAPTPPTDAATCRRPRPRRPRRADAAHALLVATLTAGGPDDVDAQGHVVIPRDTWAHALAAPADPGGPTPGPNADGLPRITITADLDDALTRTDPAPEPVPLTLLATTPPDPEHADRITATTRDRLHSLGEPPPAWPDGGKNPNELWVRIGNASKQLHGDDMATYLAQHWG